MIVVVGALVFNILFFTILLWYTLEDCQELLEARITCFFSGFIILFNMMALYNLSVM